MTELELISKLQTLRQIKPNQSWVVLSKQQIFATQTAAPSFFASFTFKSLAYSFAAFALVVAGIFGFSQSTLPGDPLFSVKKITENSQAALSGVSEVQHNAENLIKRSNDLAQVLTSQKGGNMFSAKQEVKDATKNLADAVRRDPGSAKAIAMEIKQDQTLLSFFEDTELKAEAEILYKNIIDQILPGLKGADLPEPQKEKVVEAEVLYAQAEQGKATYMQVIEIVILIQTF